MAAPWLPLSERLTEREAGRILAKLREHGSCWRWTGSTDHDGYARVWYRGRNWHMTRLLVWVLRGEAVAAGWDVAHQCHHPSCCNPAHLLVQDRRSNRAVRLAVAQRERRARPDIRWRRFEQQCRQHLREIYRYG